MIFADVAVQVGWYRCRSQWTYCTLYKTKDWQNTFSQAGVQPHPSAVKAQSKRSLLLFKGYSEVVFFLGSRALMLCCSVMWCQGVTLFLCWKQLGTVPNKFLYYITLFRIAPEWV